MRRRYGFLCMAILGLLAHPLAGDAGPAQGTDAGSAMDLICLAEQPAIPEGSSATLRAWVSTPDGQPVTGPIRFNWIVAAGRVQESGPITRWDLSSVKVDRNVDGVRTVVATVKASQAEGATAACSVQVVIGSNQAATVVRGLERPDLLQARHYLLPNELEEGGYGLYSYLLFSAPPGGAKDDEQKQRYLRTIEACLREFQEVDDYLGHNVRPKSLNVLYIPLRQAPAPEKSIKKLAIEILDAYDYTEAQILLSRVHHDHQKGPYLVSVFAPLSSQQVVAEHLWQDLTGVVPDRAQDWLDYFTWLAAQQRSWTDESLQRFTLNLRNLIAVGGKVLPDTGEAFGKVIEYFAK